MLDQDSRYVFFNRLVLGVNKPDAVPVPIDDLISGLIARFHADEAFKEIDGETATVLIKDLDYQAGKRILVLLFQLADGKVADPSFAHLKTGKARRVRKEIDEGAAVTAHVVIDLDAVEKGQAKGSNYQYRMLIEEVPRLTRLHIMSLLQQEFRQASKAAGLTYEPHPGKTHAVRAKTEIEGETANLDEELFDGEIRGVELFTVEKVGDGYDDEYELREKRRVLILRPAEPAEGSKIKAFVNYAKSVGRRERLEQMRLRYARADGKQRTAAMAVSAQASQEDRIANALTKCDYLAGFKPSLEQCEDEIRGDLSRRMIKLLRG